MQTVSALLHPTAPMVFVSHLVGQCLQSVNLLPLNSIQTEILQKLTQNKKKLFKKYKSFYIHGKTGCGKTTVMERYLLELHSQGKENRCLSMHFHDYLLDINRLLVKFSPEQIAKKIAKQIEILCFDEFFVEAIADAKILYDIFLHLIKFGVCIITTSNFSPEELYHNGFNREIMFPKFSDFLHQRMEVIHIQNIQDYRTQGEEFASIAFKNLNQFEEAFNVKIFPQQESIAVDDNHTVQIAGRFEGGIVIEYGTVLKKHTSIKDYRKLARTFTHIHIANIQSFSHNNEDEAIRFRNLVDIIYTRGMVISFDGADTIDLFQEDMLANIKFKRCHSRLNEMQTKEYISSTAKDFKRKLTIHSAEFFDGLISL
ncbi:MAG: cell division protein ZapE [Proteobacteria bacterium]|nr:cell division protein ZapE [Pseudomonadota bacterium]